MKATKTCLDADNILSLCELSSAFGIDQMAEVVPPVPLSLPVDNKKKLCTAPERLLTPHEDHFSALKRIRYISVTTDIY